MSQLQNERKTEPGNGPGVKCFSCSRSVMLSSNYHVMPNILNLADILGFPGRPIADYHHVIILSSWAYFSQNLMLFFIDSFTDT